METKRDRDGPRAPRPEEAEPRRDMRDPHASPLGRGAAPGTSVDVGPLTPSEGGVAGLHGMGVPNARGGPDGMVARENEDSKQTARRDARDSV